MLVKLVLTLLAIGVIAEGISNIVSAFRIMRLQQQLQRLQQQLDQLQRCRSV